MPHVRRARYTQHLPGLLLIVALAVSGCAEQVTPESSATPLTATGTASAPTPTPEPTATRPPVATPTTPPPTATTAYEPLPTPDEDALVPRGEITPPPSDFQPIPPRPPDPAAGNSEAWVRAYVEVVTAMLNGDQAVDEVLQTLIKWSAQEGPGQGDVSVVSWSETADVDDDGEPEWLMSLPVPERGCGATFCPAYLVLFERERGLFRPRYVIRAKDAPDPQMHHPKLIRIGDINANDKTEVVVEHRWCGAHTCATILTVGRWDGVHWQDLAVDPIRQSYTDVSIEDRDGDDVLEFTMRGGMIGSAGAGLQREHTLIFDWEDNAYRLVEEIPAPSDHPYYLVLDANRALREGDWDRALELAVHALEDPDFEGAMAPIEEIDKRRIVSYAAIEAMLVHAHQGNLDQMTAVLARARQHAFAAPNIYTEAADRLLDVFRETQGVLAACSAMEDMVRQRPEDAVFFQWYGYGTERLTLDDLCPMDPPHEGESPQV